MQILWSEQVTSSTPRILFHLEKPQDTSILDTEPSEECSWSSPGGGAALCPTAGLTDPLHHQVCAELWAQQPYPAANPRKLSSRDRFWETVLNSRDPREINYQIKESSRFLDQDCSPDQACSSVTAVV